MTAGKPEDAPATVDLDESSGLSRREPPIPETKMSPISTKRHGDVLIVTSNNPPVNALGHAVRDGLVAAIEEADDDDAVKAVVIICQGQTFFAGADITEFGKPMQMPMLPRSSTSSRIAPSRWSPRSTAPPSAAASKSRWRAITGSRSRRRSSACPRSSSACCRAPAARSGCRASPASQKALEMAATGNPIGAKEAYEIGLVDRLIEGDLEQHAVAFAEEVRDVAADPQIERARRQARRSARQSRHLRRLPQGQCAQVQRLRRARIANIKAIEAAVAKPYAEGVLDERRLFMELMTGTQARAQQYFFFAERKAAKIEGLPEDTKPREIKRVGVIGAGTMGGGISMNFLSRRHSGDDRRDGAGRARPRHRRDAQELRGERGQGADDRRPGRRRDGRC